MTMEHSVHGPQDRTRINISQAWEMAFWAQELGVSEQQLREAVQQVGPSTGNIREFLANQPSKDNEGVAT